jgi:hypothetical protein
MLIAGIANVERLLDVELLRRFGVDKHNAFPRIPRRHNEKRQPSDHQCADYDRNDPAQSSLYD